MKEKEMKALISLLDDSDKEVIRHVEEKIVSLGELIIPLLEKQWEQTFNPTIQQRIEDLVHQVQFESLKEKLKQWNNSEDQDLFTGMWLLSLYQYPDIELVKLKQDLEQLFYEVWLNFQSDLHPYDQIKILNNTFYTKLRFSPNTKNFHSPSNSYINYVLESRKGNPITLCVVYMLLAQKLKLPIYGVNLPNLFILTYKQEGLKQFYINVFNKGIIFTRADIENYIHELQLPMQDIYFEPCSNKDIIVRNLKNLIIAFEKAGEKQKVEEVTQLLEVIY
ncbi:MAG: transglutaminase-like domain-containing protein [Cyclobacteriaceae bacterium]|nr:transglutaminase-like domain-containing protein [Cyclobacteriaceae bacterium]